MNPAKEPSNASHMSPTPAPAADDRSQTSGLTDFELARIAASLAAAPQNHDKSPLQLAQAAQDLWDGVVSIRKARFERDVILATAAKMRDDDGLFGVRANGKRKSSPLITTEIWLNRCKDYPGDKHSLLLDLLFSEIQFDSVLADLFPRADISREEQLLKLVRFGRTRNFKTIIYRLIRKLGHSLPEPESQALVHAIKTGSTPDANKWLQQIGRHNPLNNWPFLVLTAHLQDLKCGNYRALLDNKTSLLVGRCLIYLRELQTSEIHKSNASMRKSTLLPKR